MTQASQAVRHMVQPADRMIDAINGILKLTENQEMIAQFAKMQTADQRNKELEQELAQARQDLEQVRHDTRLALQRAMQALTGITEVPSSEQLIVAPPTGVGAPSTPQAPAEVSHVEPVKSGESKIVQIGILASAGVSQTVAWRNQLIEVAATGGIEKFHEVLSYLRSEDDRKNHWPITGVLTRIRGKNRPHCIAQLLEQTPEAEHEALLDKLGTAFAVIDAYIATKTGDDYKEPADFKVDASTLRAMVEEYQASQANKQKGKT